MVMLKITYECGNVEYVAKKICSSDVPRINQQAVGEIAFFPDTPTTCGDKLPINKIGDIFTFQDNALIASPGKQQGPYFKLLKKGSKSAIYSSRFMDGDYYLVDGIIVINRGEVYSVVGDDIRFDVDEDIVPFLPRGLPGDQPLPPATGPVKQEKGYTKDNPCKSGGFGIAGVIFLVVLLLILGIVLLYLLLRTPPKDK